MSKEILEWLENEIAISEGDNSRWTIIIRKFLNLKRIILKNKLEQEKAMQDLPSWVCYKSGIDLEAMKEQIHDLQSDNRIMGEQIKDLEKCVVMLNQLVDYNKMPIVYKHSYLNAIKRMRARTEE